jgi:hypothetical protein
VAKYWSVVLLFLYVAASYGFASQMTEEEDEEEDEEEEEEEEEEENRPQLGEVIPD